MNESLLRSILELQQSSDLPQQESLLFSEVCAGLSSIVLAESILSDTDLILLLSACVLMDIPFADILEALKETTIGLMIWRLTELLAQQFQQRLKDYLIRQNLTSSFNYLHPSGSD